VRVLTSPGRTADHAQQQPIPTLRRLSGTHGKPRSPANAAWLAHAVIAFNLARAAGVLASTRHAKARWATLRTHLINVPVRVSRSARRLTLHLPAAWPWADAWQAMFVAATGPPAPVTP
jgi:hypothetical protein